MNLHISDTLEDISQALAAWMVEDIAKTLAHQDRYTLALSGGNTPKRLHELLASSPAKEEIDWKKIHVFWGDERDVPFDDERNNARMGFETLLDHVPVPKDQIHIMRTDIPANESVADYTRLLKSYFPEDTGTPSFDLVLLGMGDDGHTLSLFPGQPVIHEERAWVASFWLEAQQMNRITLTRPIVNRSAAIAFLVSGSGKAHALKEVLEGKYNPDLYPSQVIRPVSGNLHWFVDRAAAANL